MGTHIIQRSRVLNAGGFAAGGAVAASQTFLLDTLSATAVTAFSSRKLRAAYGGKAVNVATAVNGAGTDIGFVANGDLDNAALLTLIGSGDGWIQTAYDQVGSNNATGSVNHQPKDAVAGVPITAAGNTVCWHSVSNVIEATFYGSLQFTKSPTLAQPLTIAMCVRLTTTNSAGSAHFCDGNAAGRLLIGTSGTNYQMFAGIVSLTGGTLDTNIHALIGRFANDTGSPNSTLNVDGTTVITDSANLGTDSLSVECFAGNSYPVGGTSLDCHYCEVLIFNSIISAGDETLIRNSWRSYWGTP